MAEEIEDVLVAFCPLSRNANFHDGYVIEELTRCSDQMEAVCILQRAGILMAELHEMNCNPITQDVRNRHFSIIESFRAFSRGERT